MVQEVCEVVRKPSDLWFMFIWYLLNNGSFYYDLYDEF